MILHLLEDDKNIIERTVCMYEKLVPGESEYWVEGTDKHVLSFTEKHTLVRRFRFDNLIDEIDTSKYRAIIFHCLSSSKISFLNQLQKPINLKLTWMLWGADMYNYLCLQGYTLLNYEPSLFDIKNRILFFGSLRGAVPARIKKIIKKSNVIITNFKTAISKLDIICAYDEDFLLLKKYFPTVAARCLFYNYYPLELSLGDKLIDRQVHDNNILVGNSSSRTNNHFSAFQTLKKATNISKIIVPLGYGDANYKRFVIKKGSELLGDRFIPLVDFLPIDAYYELMLSCGIVIMPHLRQQAVGNIVIALYLGAKVFLYEENTLYDFFTKIGMTIFSINKMTGAPEEFELLDQDTMQKNREITKMYFSEKATENYIQTLIQTVGLSNA